jgi:HSP20 family molecular chaperone IbpA
MMPAWPPASQTSLASVLPSMLINPWAVMGGQGPFGLADKLLHDFEDELRMMERPGEEEGEMGRLWAAVDVKETPNEFVLSTDVPGLSKSDVHITLEDNNVLRMTGERKREDSKEGEGWKRMERSYGMFERRFKVPSNADASKIKAEMDHGVLHVHMPKMEENIPQKVVISVGGSGPQGSLKEGEHK